MVQYKSRHGTGIDTQERHGATELEFHSLTQSWHALREKRSDFTLLCMPDTITLYSLQNFRDPWLNYYFLPTATLEYKTRGEATRERIGHAFLEGSLSNIIIYQHSCSTQNALKAFENVMEKLIKIGFALPDIEVYILFVPRPLFSNYSWTYRHGYVKQFSFSFCFTIEMHIDTNRSMLFHFQVLSPYPTHTSSEIIYSTQHFNIGNELTAFTTLYSEDQGHETSKS